MTGPAASPIVLEELEFYVTMRCNLQCDFCSVNANEHSETELSLERFLELIDEASEMGLEEAHFSGGEPLLRPDLEEMVQHAANKGVHTRVITNGQLLDGRRCRGLKNAGLDEIMISLDGFEDVHNLLRGSDRAFERAIRAVRESLDAGFPTRVSMAVFRENQGQVVDLIEMLGELGVHVVSCFLGAPLGRGARHRKASVLDAGEWRTLRDDIRAVAARLPESTQVICEQGFLFSDEIELDRSELKGRGVGCGTLTDSFDFLIVRSDGNLYQCVFFVVDGEPVGNVANTTLRKALQQARQERLYQPFTQPVDRCVSCHEQSMCGLGCRGYAYLYTGDWLRTDPRCPGTDEKPPAYLPLCPILKLNARTGRFGGSSEQALAAHLEEE